MSETSRKFLEKNCPELLEEKNLRSFLLKLDDFIIAEVIAANISALFAEGKPELPKPWDYYNIFEREKEKFEKEDAKRKLEEYKESRRQYIQEYNDRKQQGLI